MPRRRRVPCGRARHLGCTPNCESNWIHRRSRIDGVDSEHQRVSNDEQVEWPSNIPSAILKGKHSVARKMIKRADQSAINYALHGCTALNACFISTHHPRNFQIASMLLAKGADPNFLQENSLKKWLTTNPFESLVVFYSAAVEAFASHGDPETLKDDLNCTTCNDLLQTIGIDGEQISSPAELLSQTKKMIQLFLDKGADPNLIINDKLWTPFFLFCMSSRAAQDLSLVDAFLRANASLSGSDIYGYSLAAHVAAWDLADGASRLLWIKSYNQRLNSGPSVANIIVEDSPHGLMECPSFMCMISSNVACAKVFMESTDYWVPTLVEGVPFKKPLVEDRHFSLEVSNRMETIPLLAPFLYNSAAMNNTFDVLRKFSDITKFCISPLVDKGFFCERNTDMFLRIFIGYSTRFSHLKNISADNYDLIRIMFGNMSAGLTQQCIRKCLYSFLFNDHPVEVIRILAEFMGRPLSQATLEALQESNLDYTSLPVDAEKIQKRLKQSTLCCIRRRAGFDECLVNHYNKNQTRKKDKSPSVDNQPSNDRSEASASLSQSSTSSRVDSSWGGGAFSLRLTTAATTKPVAKEDPYFLSMESIITFITPNVVKRICHHLGIPFGLHKRVEIEIAKLQLIVRVNAYRYIYPNMCECSGLVNPDMYITFSDSTDDEVYDLPMDS